jgi:multimeric flavodoxin WrbA
MSKKKVLVLLGSPRKEGSSASLARCLAEGAQSAGAEVEEVVIQDLDIRPCAACEACHMEGSKGCVVKDDMPLLYEKLLEADAIVFASPVRSGAVNALRTFQDVFRYIGAEIVGTVYGTGLPDGRLVNGEELGREARELGTQLTRAS